MKTQTRRQFIKTAAAASALGAASIAAPFVRTAHSAGRLKVGLWDHWVPGANDVSLKIIQDWARANGIEVSVDYITSAGGKIALTAQAEARAGVGHDIYVMPLWMTAIHQDSLEPVDDVVNDLIREFGPTTPDVEYLGKLDGTWYSVPGPIGSPTFPFVSRLDYFSEIAGIDLRKVFPVDERRDPRLVEAWNYENFLDHARKLHDAGHPFGAAIAVTPDAGSWLGPLFTAFGSVMIDAEDNIVVDSDETRDTLDYVSRLTQFMPEQIYAWDDASNNRWIISGRGSAILNPPSAWAVAKRDRPEVAAQLWHHDTLRGPKGRFRGSVPFMTGIWKFSEQKSAAKDLLRHLCRREQVFQFITASRGYDTPLHPSFADHNIWQEISPPKGGQYNYPVRGDEQLVLIGYPARPAIAAQISAQGVIPNLVARVTQGKESFDDAIAWAENEMEGFMRG